MARRNKKLVSYPVQKSAPRRVVRTIRTSNNYLKKFLLAVFILLLGAVAAYRFLQRLPVNNLQADLQSNQLSIDPSSQPSIKPEGSLFASPDPASLPIVTAQPTASPKATPVVKPTPSQTPKPSPSPTPTVKPVASQSPAPSPTPKPSPSPTPVATAMATPKPSQPTPSATNQNAETKTYTVQKGDSLWKIAQTAYNDPYQWSKIYALNKQKIGANPGILYAGMQITLPSVK